MKENYKICSRCIMDTSDKEILFDENGVCNHCHNYDKMKLAIGYNKGSSETKLKEIISEIKMEGIGKDYDVILGLSGGVDSAYLMHMAIKFNLRVLAVHVDAGWNSITAVENIHKLCNFLNVDLKTIVIDWATMKELQRAYMFSGLANLDIPQDHAFLAAMYSFARKNNLKFMLNGSNIATESILPASWGYKAMDYWSIENVYKKHGRGKSLKKYPKLGLISHYYMQVVIKRVNLLNYIDYSKKSAIELLAREYGWEYYGGKHFESVFTKFFQSYYLPKKFGYDKKRAHLSSLVVNGEMSREQALLELDDDSVYTIEEMLEDRDYIIKKLDISIDEWNQIMESENKTENDYSNQKIARNIISEVRKIFKSK